MLGGSVTWTVGPLTFTLLAGRLRVDVACCCESSNETVPAGPAGPSVTEISRPKEMVESLWLDSEEPDCPLTDQKGVDCQLRRIDGSQNLSDQLQPRLRADPGSGTDHIEIQPLWPRVSRIEHGCLDDMAEGGALVEGVIGQAKLVKALDPARHILGKLVGNGSGNQWRVLCRRR